MTEALVNLDAAPEVVDEVVESDGVDTTNEVESDSEKLLAGKYKNVEELEKGYKELSKMARENKVEIPDEYSFDMSELEGFETVEINKEDPFLQDMVGVFKQAGISDQQASVLVANFNKLQGMSDVDPEKEMSKLGEDAKVVIPEIERFFAKNKANFSEEELTSIASMTTTADGVRAINRMINMTHSKPVPTDDTKPIAAESSADLFAKAFELKDTGKLDQGKHHRDEYQRLMNRASEAKLAGR